jgi:endo-1,4-beta-mannosidase
MEDLEHDRNLGPAEAAEICDFLTMHGYPGYASWTDGATDERLLPFLSRLTARLGGDRDVLFSEFGVPTQPDGRGLPESDSQGPALVSETEAASYIGRALRALHRSGSTGGMLWCHSDYSAELFDAPPFDLASHERSFGQWRADASAKPSVAVVREFVDQRSTLPPVEPLAHAAWFDLDVEQYYRSPETELPRLFQRYCSAEAARSKGG